MPAEIILLRHGEKVNPYHLSKIGEERARALPQVYLGKDASQSLLPAGVRPAALMTVILYTIETITSPAGPKNSVCNSPPAQRWNKGPCVSASWFVFLERGFS